MPKRKPRLVNNTRRRGQPEETKAKPPAAPKKFTAFSASDSKAIEARYQRLLEGTEDSKGTQKKANPDQAKVPVNEDFLFDVDILERELAPVYWLGPVYEGAHGWRQLMSAGVGTNSFSQSGEELGFSKRDQPTDHVRRT